MPYTWKSYNSLWLVNPFVIIIIFTNLTFIFLQANKLDLRQFETGDKVMRMEQNIEQQREVNGKDPMHGDRNKQWDKLEPEADIFRKHEQKSNKCIQCEYVSSHASHLKAHLKTHSGEKSNKCNQCDYASIQAGDLRRHVKTHSGEKSNKDP